MGQPFQPSFVDTLLARLVGRVPVPGRVAGEPVPPVAIPADALGVLIAARLRAGGDTVVWVDPDGAELLVEAAAARVAVLDGAVAVGLPVRCDGAAPSDLTVVLLVADGPGGNVPLVMVDAPARGDPALVARWGEAATAAVLDATVAVLFRSSAAAGTGVDGRPLVPAEIWSRSGELVVRPRALFPGEVRPS